MNNEKAYSYILIVDDVPENIQLLGTLLKESHYNLEIANNGKIALEMIQKQKPDLILLDVMMPELDGFELCKILKSDKRYSDISIIFLTAKTATEDILYGFEIGAVDYVTKPFNSSELISRVNTHIELKKSREVIIKSNMEQKELLHILSHDLATPFNSMVYLTDLIDDFENIDDLKNFTGLIRESAYAGIETIALVRRMRSIESGKIKLTSCSLIDAVKSCQNLLNHELIKKDITLTVIIDKSFTVFAERVSLSNSVISNLLTNSIKFSYPGSEIIISAKRDIDTVILSVKDYGIGIPKKALDNIFDYTKTTSRIGTGGETGTGFGMSLIKKFTDLYGALIEIKSVEKIEENSNHGTETLITFNLN